MRKMEDKKLEQKQAIHYLLMMLVFFSIGLFFGFVTVVMKYMDINPFRVLEESLENSAPVFLGIAVFLAAVMCGIEIMYYIKVKRAVSMYSQDDEEQIDRIERLISKAGILLNIAPPIVILFYFTAIHIDRKAMSKGIEASLVFLVFIMAVLVLMLVTTLFYGKVFRIEGDLNPTKRAVNIYSLVVFRQLEQNSDEGERRILYESGFHAFEAMIFVASIMMFITILIPVQIESVMLVLYAVIIYLAGMIAFSYTSWKLEHGGGQK